MALTTATTLAAAMTVNDLVATVTSATGLLAGQFIRIDNEYAKIAPSYVSGVAVPLTQRGDLGSAVVAHTILAPVVAGLYADIPDLEQRELVPVPSDVPNLVTISVDSTPTVPTTNTTYFIDKATACAITLSAPSAAVNGVIVRFFSTTAAAHTVTYTAGFHANTTSSDVATFAATAGQCLSIMAYQGKWGIVALGDGVTLG